MENIKFNII